MTQVHLMVDKRVYASVSDKDFSFREQGGNLFLDVDSLRLKQSFQVAGKRDDVEARIGLARVSQRDAHVTCRVMGQ